MLFRSSLRQRPLFLSCPFFVAAAPPLFILPGSRCGSAPLFFAQFSLRQRPCILYCPFLVVAAPHFFYCSFLVAAAPRLFILPISRCGSAPLSILPGFRCGSAPGFYMPFSRFGSRSEEQRLNSSHLVISYAVFCLKKKKKTKIDHLKIIS